MVYAAKSLQLCPTLCDPTDGSTPSSPVPGILQARTLEWVAIFFFNAWKWKVKVKSLSRVRPSATPWIAAYQAPPFMGFSRQEYWSRVPLPSPLLWGRIVIISTVPIRKLSSERCAICLRPHSQEAVAYPSSCFVDICVVGSLWHGPQRPPPPISIPCVILSLELGRT